MPTNLNLTTGTLARLPLLSQLVIRTADLVMTWQGRQRSRKQLDALDSRLLADIGLDPKAAVIEAEKPFWRA